MEKVVPFIRGERETHPAGRAAKRKGRNIADAMTVEIESESVMLAKSLRLRPG